MCHVRFHPSLLPLVWALCFLGLCWQWSAGGHAREHPNLKHHGLRWDPSHSRGTASIEVSSLVCLKCAIPKA